MLSEACGDVRETREMPGERLRRTRRRTSPCAISQGFVEEAGAPSETVPIQRLRRRHLLHLAMKMCDLSLYFALRRSRRSSSGSR